jgi:ketosteroid isomerase-like protein
LSPEEVVRACWAAWAERDLDRLQSFWHDDISWDLTQWDESPPGLVGHGVAEVMDLIAMWMTQWRSYELTVEEISAGAGEHVLVLVRRRAREKGTDRVADRLAAQVWTVRDGLVQGIATYGDVDEGRRAAGLA